MYRITKKSINKNTHACTLYISNTFVERSQATGNIYNLVFQIFLPLYYQNYSKAYVPALSTLQWRLCDTAHGAIKELL